MTCKGVVYGWTIHPRLWKLSTGFTTVRSATANKEKDMTYRNYPQHYFFEMYLFPSDGICYGRLLWYVVVMDCVIEVADETAKSWALDKTKRLEKNQYECKESSWKLTRSHVATIASKCS